MIRANTYRQKPIIKRFTMELKKVFGLEFKFSSKLRSNTIAFYSLVKIRETVKVIKILY